MLKTIPAVISPDLMYILMTMGHGDELVLADANFPSAASCPRCVFLSGHALPGVLDAIARFFPLDAAVEENAYLMDAPDALRPHAIWNEYETILRRRDDNFHGFCRLEKPDFYARAKTAFGVVSTGECTRFSNLILRKGVVTPPACQNESRSV